MALLGPYETEDDAAAVCGYFMPLAAMQLSQEHLAEVSDFWKARGVKEPQTAAEQIVSAPTPLKDVGPLPKKSLPQKKPCNCRKRNSGQRDKS